MEKSFDREVRILIVAGTLDKMPGIDQIYCPADAEKLVCQIVAYDEAKRECALFNPDLVLIGLWEKERGQAWSALEELREADAWLLIILLDWAGLPPDPEWLYSLHVGDYIRYPGSPEKLREKLHARVPNLLKIYGFPIKKHVYLSDHEEMEELRSMNGLWGQIVDSSTLSVTCVDMEGRLVAFNRGAELLTGYTREEALGQDVMLFYREQSDFKRITELLHKRSRIENAETVIRAKDGRDVPIALSLGLIREKNGTVLGSYGIGMDITERKRMLEEMENRNKGLDSFAHTIAHGLRNPLIAIHGLTRILLEDFSDQLPPTVHEFLDRIDKNCTLTQDLVEGLFRFARFSADNAEFTIVDCGAVLEEVRDQLRRDITGSHAAIMMEGEPPKVTGEPIAIHQVFYNLLSNALKFSSPERKPVIRIKFTPGESMHLFSIADNGIGIPPGMEARLFKMFDRLNADKKISGTGVGLAIVERIIKRHGGIIWVESAPPPGGAVFHFKLPAAQ
ncbi:PAS domain S-box protein [bacterium]|nr:PAS domain S-box protein [candidate division CSSED10-310 bacterium]